MKRYLFILLLFVSTFVSGQVINFAKTLPLGSFSIGAATAYNMDNHSADYVSQEGGVSFIAFGGFGINYSLDVNFKYAYFPGADYFGADMQYLFKETRKSYFTMIGGLHYQENLWVDIAGTYTYIPEQWLNFSVGLDVDVGLNDSFLRRFWVPLNAGVNVGNIIFIFLEYDLPVSEYAWDMITLGANFIIR